MIMNVPVVVGVVLAVCKIADWEVVLPSLVSFMNIWVLSVLALITGYYAFQTRELVKETRTQAEESRRALVRPYLKVTARREYFTSSVVGEGTLSWVVYRIRNVGLATAIEPSVQIAQTMPRGGTEKSELWTEESELWHKPVLALEDKEANIKMQIKGEVLPVSAEAMLTYYDVFNKRVADGETQNVDLTEVGPDPFLGKPRPKELTYRVEEKAPT